MDRIRSIRRDDAPLVCRFAAALNEALGVRQVPFDTDRLEALLGGASPFLYGWIAERRERPVGYALCQDFFDTDTGSMATWLLDLYVDESSRGQGLGQQLLKAVARHAVAAGRQLVSFSAHRNNPAVRLYQRIGAGMPEEAILFELRADRLHAFAGVSP